MYAWSTSSGGSGVGTKANVNNAYFWNGGAGSSSRIYGTPSNVIDFFDRTASGVASATDRGDDINSTSGPRGCHDATRSYRVGKMSSSSGGETNVAYIDLTVNNTNAVDAADLLTYDNRHGGAALNGPVYGYCNGSGNTLEYVTLANMSGNAADAGDLSYSKRATQGISNTSYGHVLGGYSITDLGKDDRWNNDNTVDYIDATTTSTNGTDRMNMFLARRLCGTISGGTQGYICGGVTSTDLTVTGTATNAIEYFDTSTNSGAAADRSDLSVAMGDLNSNNDSQGFSHGLVGTGTHVDRLDMFTHNANAVDRGDRTVDNKYASCCN